jgi:putative ABC transport system permease protein
VLLVGAGLLLRSFERLTHKNPGFNPEHLVVFDVSLPGEKYKIDDALIRFAGDVTTRLASLPGTEHVAIAADRPFDPDSPFHASTSFTVDGDPRPEPGTEPEARLLPVSPNYFTTMGQSLARGRAFTDAENRRDVPPVVVINEALAEKYFAGQNPIGKRLTFGLSHTFTANSADSLRVRGEVVGVAKDAAYESVAQRQEPVAYVAYATLPLGATFLVRTTSDPSAIEGAIQRQLHDIDPNVPIYELGLMDDALAASVAQPRFYSILLAAFAAIALLLATLGIFGVISYTVNQRTREFGIRIALGATATDVSGAVVRRGVAMSAIGVVIGVGTAVAATGAIRAMLFETSALDAPTIFSVAALLIGVASLASWLPARRAGRVDPTVAMRAE